MASDTTPFTGPLGAAMRAGRMLLVIAAIGISVGGIMGFISYGFVAGVHYLTLWRDQTHFAVVQIGAMSVGFGPMLILVAAAFVVLGLRRFVATPYWHGPPETIHAAHLHEPSLDVRAGLASTLAAFVSAGGGASVGQYGPLVHFGATIASFMRQRLGTVVTVDVFIGCGVAGAIAAGFNAPIAGVIFAHEAILRHFSLRAIAPIVISSITAAWVRAHILAGEPLFQIDAGAVDLGSLLPVALVAGPVFGVLAVLYMHSVRYSAHLAARTKWSPARRIMTAAVITGVIASFVPAVLGLGITAMQAMLDGAYTGTDLLVLVALKLVVTAICIGFGFAGGVFLPAMFVGLGAGALLSRGIMALGLLIPGTGLAVCGMAAVGAAVIGAPIAAVLIVLEVTASYELALAAMVSIVTAIAVSHALFGSSYFDRLLKDRGVDMTRGRSHIQMTHARIESCISATFTHTAHTASVAEVRAALHHDTTSECYLLDAQNRLKGKVTLGAIIDAAPDAPAAGHATMDIVSIAHDASLQEAIEGASNFVGETIPVVNGQTGIVVGVVTEAALFQQYLALQNRITTTEHT